MASTDTASAATKTNDKTNPVVVGDRVVRVQGRPTDVGRTGVVTTVHNSPDLVGSAGDVLITVAGDDGEAWRAYDRQVRHQ